jgi:hypothetical protein
MRVTTHCGPGAPASPAAGLVRSVRKPGEDPAMKLAPRLLLTLLVLLGAAGCRTASTGSLAQRRPPEVRPQSSFDLQDFVAQHNENAERIKSLEANPSIAARIGPPGQDRTGGVKGKLALERPRNFKLEISRGFSTVADIGSNDDRFWFWFQNDKDKSIYVCDYAELNSTSLAVTYQPDWIAEALGLKVIGPDEAAQVKIDRGPQPGTSAMTFPLTRSGGQPYARTMIVSDITGRLVEFRVFAPDGKTMIAQATIKKYQNLPLRESEKRVGGSGTCYVPENIVLEWKREKLSLDIALKEAKLNQFEARRRTALFVEPTIEGYAHVNLAEIARSKDQEGSTAVRETMPAPQPRGSRARLSPPLEIRSESAATTPTRRKDATTPAPASTRSPLLLPVLDLDVVTAPIPSAPESTASAAMTVAPRTTIER